MVLVTWSRFPSQVECGGGDHCATLRRPSCGEGSDVMSHPHCPHRCGAQGGVGVLRGGVWVHQTDNVEEEVWQGGCRGGGLLRK